MPFNACEFQSKGDPVTDLFEDLAAEQKARSTYDNILRVVTDPDVCEPIRFLKEARDRPLPALRRSPPRSSGSWTPETSTLSTQASIRCRLRQEIHGRRIEKEIPFLFHKIYGRKGSLFSSNIRPGLHLALEGITVGTFLFVGLSSCVPTWIRSKGAVIHIFRMMHAVMDRALDAVRSFPDSSFLTTFFWDGIQYNRTAENDAGRK